MAKEITYQHTESGATLYAKAEPLDTGTWANGIVSMTEDGDRGGYYTADVDLSTAADGYTIFEQAGENPADSDDAVAVADLTLAKIASGQTVVRANNADGDKTATADSIGATPEEIWAYSSRTLTGGTAVAVSPIDSSDNVSIYRGTDYDPSIGTTLSWSKSGYPAAEWESDATGSFRYRLVNSATTVEAGAVSLTHDGDETLTATLTLTDEETAAITGAGRYELIVTTGDGLIRAFAYGNLSITDKVPDPE